jgi:outer membrane protein assembly factor BamB
VTWHRIGVALTALALLALAPSGAGASEAAKTLWLDAGVHVVGGPVAAPGRVIVIVAGPERKTAWLEAVDAETGALIWKVPESFSAITQGVAFDPTVVNGIVLAMAPAKIRGTTSLEGVDVITGRTVWRTGLVVVVDPPSPCPPPLGKQAFCVTEYTSSSEQDLVAYPALPTGKAPTLVRHVSRAMSLPNGLYETDSPKPVLAQVETPGGVVWSATVARLFGAGYSPDSGWDFVRYGPVEAGSLGPTGTTLELGKAKTVGIAVASGHVIWRIPGEFQCGGSELKHPFVCLMTGTANYANGHLNVSRGATLILEGLDPRTGKITWRLRATGIADLLLQSQEIADGEHMLVTTPSGRKVVLDLETGRTSPPRSDAVFWCTSLNTFDMAGTAAARDDRVGTTRFAGCDRRGHPLASLGSPTPPAGVTVAGVFVWASPHGLAAARVG